MREVTEKLARLGIHLRVVLIVTAMSLVLCWNGYALTEQKIVGVWEAEISSGIHVAIEFMPSHRATFLLVRSEIFPNWQVKDETIVLSFPENRQRISADRLVVIGMDAEGLHFLRSGLLLSMPEEMERVPLLRASTSFRRIEETHGGMYYDLKDKKLPQTLSDSYVEVLARLWQFDIESLATIISLPNAKPETLRWAYALLPTKDWRGDQRKLALAIAGNANTPLEILDNAWTTWNEPRYWRALAYNPAVAGKYRKDYNGRVLSGSVRARAEVAEDTNLPADLMECLARDSSVLVTRNLAFNKRVTSATLAILAVNADESVRRAVALHPNIAPETQVLLARDERPYVQRDLLLNPKVVDDARDEAVSHLSRAPHEDFRFEAASRVAANSDGFKVLLADYSPKVRKALAGNPAMPVVDLLRLLEDDFLPVRREAMKQLATRATQVPKELKARLRPEEELRQSLDLRSEILESVRNNDLGFIKWLIGIPEYQPLFGDMVSILKVALETDNRAIVDYFADNHKTGEALIGAIKGADHLDPALLQHLISDGLVQREMHFRLMNDCVEQGKPQLLERLIAFGLDPSSKGPHSVTLLHVAAAKNNPEMVDFLIKRKLSLSEMDEQKRTPADIAAMNYSITLLTKLDKSGKYKLLIEDFRKEFKVPADSPFIGTWARRKEGFGSVALTLVADGTGALACDFGCGPVAWKQVGEEAQVFTLERSGPVRKNPLILVRHGDGGLTSKQMEGAVLLREQPKQKAAESGHLADSGKEIRFPDKNFAQAVRTQVLSKNPAAKKVYEVDVKDVESLRVQDLKIADLTGIEAFVGLQALHCGRNLMTGLDVSHSEKLLNLSCFNNPLTHLNISGLQVLELLDCFSTALTDLDLRGCKQLRDLNCELTFLSRLDLTNCENLAQLHTAASKLTELRVAGLAKLATLSCSKNELSTLDLNGCSSLMDVDCDWNRLKDLNLFNRVNLNRLLCSHNNLTNLDVSGCTQLMEVNCSYNQSSKMNLNVSGCRKLGFLSCSHSGLTGTLDLSTCTNLVSVYAVGNNLSEIIVGDLSRLPEKFKYDQGVSLRQVGP